MNRFIIPVLVALATITNCSILHHLKKQPEFTKNPLKLVHYAFKNDEKIEIKTIGVKNLDIEPSKNWIAKAIYDADNYNKTGWSTLEIETNVEDDNDHQAYAAGYLEGKLTKDLISLHLLNTVGDFCKDSSKSCEKLIAFLKANFKWLMKQIKENEQDPYWHQVKLSLIQFHGLYNGYNGIEQFIGTTDILELMHNDIEPYMNLLVLQMNGDVSELLASLNQVSDPFMAGSCSALIKVLPNNKDLYVAHDTWTEYESMLRILKLYKLNYRINNKDPVIIPGSEISFSSYPGILVSIDDFYVLNSRLIVTETTIGNSNTDLWKHVTSDTILYWVRLMVSNRLAYTGQDWAKLFALHNSGTYNNEWMIVDYKLFTPGQPLRDGLFTVLEQIPGTVYWEDRTDTLRNTSYWSSYNIAYYPHIYNMSGAMDAFIKYGDFFSYTHSPRSNIFRRDHHKVNDIESMINLMRYNNFTKDPLSECSKCSPPYSGENTIAARSDLNPATGKYPFDALGHRDHGATDMKLTNFKLSETLQFISIAGPTHDDADVTPFVWSQADFGSTTNHFGHPDKWTFEPFCAEWNL